MRPPVCMKLTRRDVEVLELLADGLSNTDVGARLGISEDTVRSHVRRLSVKLGARGRAGIVGAAFRRGALEAEPKRRVPFEEFDGLIAVPAEAWQLLLSASRAVMASDWRGARAAAHAGLLRVPLPRKRRAAA